MVIEEALEAHLKADPGISAITSAVYPKIIPIGAPSEAISYQRIDGPRISAHDGPTGLAFPRFQLTIVGRDYATVKSLAAACRISLDGFRGVMGGAGGVMVESCELDNDYDLEDQAGATSEVMRQDYIIFHQEV